MKQPPDRTGSPRRPAPAEPWPAAPTARAAEGDERLRRLLHEGDPASDGKEPAPPEVQRLRRTILIAAEEAVATRPSWRGLLWRPIAGAVAAAGLALAVGLALRQGEPGTSGAPGVASSRQRPPGPGGRGEGTPRPVRDRLALGPPAAPPQPGRLSPPATAARPPAAPLTSGAAPVPGAFVAAREPAQASLTTAGSSSPPGPAQATVATAVSGAPAGSSTTGPPDRRIQFSLPGGTRVVWVLDPRFSLSDSTL